ncbi:MAG: hypothetical protein KAT34_17085 [Candidatus Aminicenantes bacterium]|nr:hypothetical protein [Candidatus Aminicenantes bacterium]
MCSPGIEFKKAWKNKNTVQYQKIDLHVVSRSDLISSKIAVGQKKDLEDVKILQLEKQQ